MNSTVGFFDEHIVMLYTHLVNQYMPEYFLAFEYTPWIFSLLGSVVIGLSGILPLLIIPTDEKLNEQGFKDRKWFLLQYCLYPLHNMYT